MAPAALTVALLFAAIWALICRIRHMTPATTKPAVFAQHALLALSLFAAMLLPPEWSKASMAAGILAYLLVSSRRWRTSAPEGTEREASTLEDVQPVTPQMWSKVSGGKGEHLGS